MGPKGAGRNLSERVPRSSGSGSARSDGAGPAKDSVREAVAVALKYAPESASSATKVGASGRGALAEQILDPAFPHGVRVREDADVPENLGALDSHTEITVETFNAVASILHHGSRPTA